VAEHVLALVARKLGRPATLGVPEAGDVRELRHAVERAVVTAEGGQLAVDLPAASRPAAAAPPGPSPPTGY
jgi:hypothetical protein